MHYLGPWDDADGALKKHREQKDDLHAGRTPRAKVDGVEMRDLVNRFLTHKKQLLDSGEIKQRTRNELDATCSRLINTFGRDRLGMGHKHEGIANIVPCT